MNLARRQLLSRSEPRYGALTDIETPRQVGLRRRAGGERLSRFLALMPREGRGSPHVNATRLGPLAALPGAGADQLALELREASQHGEHEPPVRRRGVRPGVGQGSESGADFRNGVERVEKIAR